VGLLPHDAAPPVVLHAVTATGPEQFGAHPTAYPLPRLGQSCAGGGGGLRGYGICG
jgi:hypothetical protein